MTRTLVLALVVCVSCGGSGGSGTGGGGGIESGGTGGVYGSGGSGGSEMGSGGRMISGTGGMVSPLKDAAADVSAANADSRDAMTDAGTADVSEAHDGGADSRVSEVHSPMDLAPPADASSPTDADVEVNVDLGVGGSPSRLAMVQIEDAIIGPGKVDGTAWDGTVVIPQEVFQDLGTALAGGNPVGGTLAVLAGPTLNDAISSLDKPDPYGFAQLTVLGQVVDESWLANRDDAIADSYTPIWPYGWHYENIPIDTDVRIRIELWDKDLINDDPIGVAVINSGDLKAALAAQKKYEVRIDDQTADQLLFIGISVVLQ